MAESECRYHVRGYLKDGREVDRRYKTKAAADRMIRRMPIVSCALLFTVDYSAVDAALRRLDGGV